MNFASYISLILIIVGIHTVSYADGGYTISIKLQDNQDEQFYLARYHGEQVYMVDTSYSDKPGHAKFTGETALPAGIYIVASVDKTKLLEFIVDQDQHFEIEVSSAAGQAVFDIKDSHQNSLFFDHIQLNNALVKTTTKLKAMNGNSEDDISMKATLYEKDSLTGLIKNFKEQLVSGYPDYLLSKIILAMQEVEIPDSLGKKSQAAYLYYRNRYWQTVDLADKRLLNTPLLPAKVSNYFDQLVPPHADSIINAIDRLIELTRDNTDTRDYLIWHFTSEYQNPKIMGLDKVFVHLADNYFAKLEISNTSESVRAKIMGRADQLRHLLIGAKAPDLRLVDTTGQFVSFQHIDAQYIVLFFWDFDCGICKKDLLVLKDFYQSKEYNFEVYAIGTNADMEGWKKYIRDNGLDWVNVNGTRSITHNFHDLYDIYGTPVIYVLDNKKSIIAKRINADQLKLVFENDSKLR